MLIEKEIKKYAQQLLREYEEEQSERLNETKPVYLLTDVITALINKEDVNLHNINAVRSASLFSNDYIVTIQCKTESGEEKELVLDLEDFFSANSDLNTKDYTIKFNTNDIRTGSFPLDRVRSILRLFCMLVDNFFGGVISAKQLTNNDLLGFSIAPRSQDTNEFKNSFIWPLFNRNTGLGAKLFQNEHIDLNNKIPSTNKLSYIDILLIKSTVLYVFDTYQEIFSHIGIDINKAFSNDSEYKRYNVFIQLMTHFVTVSSFERYIENPTYAPVARKITSPDAASFKSVLMHDNKGEAIKLKKEIFDYIGHLKFLVLKYIDTFKNKASAIPDESSVKQENNISFLIKEKLRLLKEEQTSQNEEELIINAINNIVSTSAPGSPLPKEEISYSKEAFNNLISKESVIKQVKQYKDILDSESDMSL